MVAFRPRVRSSWCEFAPECGASCTDRTASLRKVGVSEGHLLRRSIGRGNQKRPLTQGSSCVLRTICSTSTRHASNVEPAVRFELTTYRLQVGCASSCATPAGPPSLPIPSQDGASTRFAAPPAGRRSRPLGSHDAGSSRHCLACQFRDNTRPSASQPPRTSAP